MPGLDRRWQRTSSAAGGRQRGDTGGDGRSLGSIQGCRSDQSGGHVKEHMTPTVRSRTDNVRRAKARLRRNEGVRSDELLEIALLLFSEEGYREVTMQKIADRLGIRHSLIYYYFESKDKLFHSALLHALERLMAAYDEVKARHEDPVEIINDWFRLNVDQEQLLKGLINIMIDHASHERRRTTRWRHSFPETSTGSTLEQLCGGTRRSPIPCSNSSCKFGSCSATISPTA